MQKDFHYYVIGILARHAGFDDGQARLIAHASQYVDHATESFPLHLRDGRVVETTMTAHYHVQSFSTGVQRDVYMCFHFPPLGLKEGRFQYQTVADSPVIRALLRDILKSRKAAKQPISQGGHPFWLYRLGVALHTYADSWSHQTFSGRHHRENDVGKLWFGKKTDDWARQDWNDWKYDIAPQIGHCEIGNYVDQPYRVLKYELFSPETKCFEVYIRQNPEQMIEAAQACLGWLRRFSEGGRDWDETHPNMCAIRGLLAYPNEKEGTRIDRWKTSLEFACVSDLFTPETDYDPDRWPREAFGSVDGRALRRDNLKKPHDRFYVKETDGFDHSDFRLFHKAARRQRVFVLDSLFW